MRIEKREDALKAAYWKRFAALHPAGEYTLLALQDVRKSGHPDNALNGYGATSWWEFKHATPRFSSPGIQELTCVRLAKHTYCRYIIFLEHRDIVQTLIVHPRQVHQKHGKLDDVSVEVRIEGHDFDALAEVMHNIHANFTASVFDL